jgi:hypothetical protein
VNTYLSRLLALGLGIALSASLAVGVSTPALAKDRSTVKASTGEVKALIVDLGLIVPAKCLSVRLVRADKRWGSYSGRSPRPSGCMELGDDPSIIVKKSGTWMVLPLMNDTSCEQAKAMMRQNGASSKVISALTKKWSC